MNGSHSGPVLKRSGIASVRSAAAGFGRGSRTALNSGTRAQNAAIDVEELLVPRIEEHPVPEASPDPGTPRERAFVPAQCRDPFREAAIGDVDADRTGLPVDHLRVLGGPHADLHALVSHSELASEVVVLSTCAEGDEDQLLLTATALHGRFEARLPLDPEAVFGTVLSGSRGSRGRRDDALA